MSETDNTSMSSRQRLVHTIRKRSSRLKKVLNGNFNTQPKSGHKTNTPVEELSHTAATTSSEFLDGSDKPKYKLYCIRNPSLDGRSSRASANIFHTEFNSRGGNLLRMPKAEKINPAFDQSSAADEARWAERVASERRDQEARDAVTNMRQNQALVEPVNTAPPVAPPPRKYKPAKEIIPNDLNLETSHELMSTSKTNENSTQVPVNSPQLGAHRGKAEPTTYDETMQETTNHHHHQLPVESGFILPEPISDSSPPMVEESNAKESMDDDDEEEIVVSPQRSTFITSGDEYENESVAATAAPKISMLQVKNSFGKGSKINQGYGSFNFNIDV